jgi:hypothetical protein
MDGDNDGSSGYTTARKSVPILPSQIIPIEVECIRNMLQSLSRPALVLYHHDIEPAGTISNTMLGEILRGQLDQFCAFAGIDRFDGTPEGSRSPPFDLDEYQHALIICDQIEFT